MLSDMDFNGLAIEKGEFVGIINKFCKEKLAVWLVLKENEFNIVIEIRYLNKKDGNALLNQIFEYVDSRISRDMPFAASQRVAKTGKDNLTLLISVMWSKKGVS